MMKKALNEILAWHEAARRPVARCLRSGISASALSKLEKTNGLALPESARALLLWRDGTTMRSDRTVDDLAFVPGFFLLSARNGFRERADSEEAPGWNPLQYPFLSNGGGDRYTITCGEAGSRRPEDGEVSLKRFDSHEHKPVYTSLEGMWVAVARMFREGALREEEGRLIEDMGAAASIALDEGHRFEHWESRARAAGSASPVSSGGKTAPKKAPRRG